jgi:uncharacterized protein YlxW (UPF0749 family)
MDRFLDSIIPLISVMMVFGIPLAAILTHHQRKMAELIHGNNQKHAESQEVSQLQEEVRQLRERSSKLMLEVDDLRHQMRALGGREMLDVDRETQNRLQ